MCDAIPDPPLVFVLLRFHGRSSLQHTVQKGCSLLLVLLSHYNLAAVW